MIARPSRPLGQLETKIRKIKLLDKRIDHANHILVVDPVFQMIRKKHPLISGYALDVTLHPYPPYRQKSIEKNRIF